MGVAGKHPMWVFQSHFRIAVKAAAEGVFNLLDPSLRPHVFLVGFLHDKTGNRPPVCVEPDDDSYPPALFQAVPERAQEHFHQPTDSVWVHPDRSVEDEYERRRFRACLGHALYQVLEKHADPAQWVTSCSAVMEVQSYLVSVVLQLSRAAYDSWPRLKKDVDEEQCGLKTSLIDATVYEFLEFCTQELSKPNPGQSLLLSKEYPEIVRAAGKSFMYTASNAGKNFSGLHGLFEACNTISSLRYEGAEGVGQLVVAPEDHPGVVKDIELLTPIPITDLRAARKMLELASDQQCLLCDSANVYALGHIATTYDPARENLFVIKFLQYHMWELWHDRAPLMRVTYGEPRLPRPEFDVDVFKRKVARIFPGLSVPEVNHLADLARAASRQRNGTMLVISTQAESEAARLENQCVRIRPKRLKPEALELVTAIDGAVLVDTSGACHAIGVILDGLASPKGTSSRGARYNSAVRYVYSRVNCLAIVISEDGMIDFVPDLRPQVRRSKVDGALSQLRAVCADASVDSAKLQNVMGWLSHYRFYLSQADCEEVNRLWRLGKERVGRDELRRLYDDFVPDPEMNPTYYLAESRG
jgi:hypothetical protein